MAKIEPPGLQKARRSWNQSFCISDVHDHIRRSPICQQKFRCLGANLLSFYLPIAARRAASQGAG